LEKILFYTVEYSTCDSLNISDIDVIEIDGIRRRCWLKLWYPKVFA